MPRCSSALPASVSSSRYLARRRTASMRWPGSSSRISAGIGQRRSGRRRVDAGDDAAFDMRRQAATGGFDFGQLGHGASVLFRQPMPCSHVPPIQAQRRIPARRCGRRDRGVACRTPRANWMQALARSGLDAAGRVHEGVHRARKALRRTRARPTLGDRHPRPSARIAADRHASCAASTRGLSVLRDVAGAGRNACERLLRSALDDAASRQLLQSARSRGRRCAASCVAAARPRCLDPGAGPAAFGTDASLRAALPALRLAKRLTPSRARSRWPTATQQPTAPTSPACAHDDGEDDDWHRWRRRARRASQQRRALDAVGVDPGRRRRPDGFDKRTTERLGGAAGPDPAAGSLRPRFPVQQAAPRRRCAAYAEAGTGATAQSHRSTAAS